MASDVRTKVKNTAGLDNSRHPGVRIRLPQDPGQAGKEQAQSYVKYLAGYSVKTLRVSGDKITRAEPFSSQWQAGNVLILAGSWNDVYFSELESFPDGSHDDMVDASSDAFSEVTVSNPIGHSVQANVDYAQIQCSGGPDIVFGDLAQLYKN
jgi:predicted phage terminase large subunit-like protein